MAIKTYEVKSPIKSGGKIYKPATDGVVVTLDLDEEVAAPHVLTGVLADTEAKPAFVVHTAPADEAERRAAIKVAIGEIDLNNPDLLMKSGAPKTEAIQAVVKWPVTGKDRDAVWAEIVAEAKGE